VQHLLVRERNVGIEFAFVSPNGLR